MQGIKDRAVVTNLVIRMSHSKPYVLAAAITYMLNIGPTIH